MFSFHNLSIKNKLIAMMMFVSFFAITSGFSIVIYSDIKTFKNDMAENTLATARFVGEYCETPLEFDYDYAATETLEGLKAIPAVSAGIVYDNEGRIFASYSNSNELDIKPFNMPVTSSFVFKDHHLHVSQPVFYYKGVGAVYLKLSTKELDKKIRNYLLTMGFFLLIIIGISFIIASNFQKLLSKPIIKLAQATDVVSASADYSLRLEKNSNDEIGILYDGFNEMLKQIDTRDAELQQKNTELERLIDTSPDAIIITGTDHRITIANNQFMDMCGVSNDQGLLGKEILNFVNKEDTQSVSKELDTIIESGTINGIEFSIMQNESTTIPVELNASLLVDSNNNPKYIINIIRDITERKTLEENIERLRREHEAFMRHEIKNILFPIQGFAEILLLTDNDKLDDTQKNYLQMIRDDSLRAGQLVDRLKMLQDIEKGEFTLNLQKYPLKIFIEKAIADLKMLSEENGISLIRDFSECPDIKVDANLIQGVFTNLLKNAIEHIQDSEHEKDKVVTVKLYPQNGKTVISINNKGEIIPPEKLKVFFEKFNTDRTKKKDGTGLGTTYAYLVTKAHGGDIIVDSNTDDGTTVTVIF